MLFLNSSLIWSGNEVFDQPFYRVSGNGFSTVSTVYIFYTLYICRRPIAIFMPLMSLVKLLLTCTAGQFFRTRH